MDKMIAEFLSIAMLGAFLFAVFFIGGVIKKRIESRFGKDFFIKNKDKIKKHIIILAIILTVLGVLIGLFI